MDGGTRTINLKRVFFTTAPWFSFFTPVACGGFILALFGIPELTSWMNSFTDNLQKLIWQWIFSVIVAIQILSLMSGVLGVFAPYNQQKVLAILGILAASAVGFVAYMLWRLETYGLWGGC